MVAINRLAAVMSRKPRLRLRVLRTALPHIDTKRWGRRDLVQIACLVVHQSLSPQPREALKPGVITQRLATYHSRSEVRAREMARRAGRAAKDWRMYGRNWPGLAYHYSIEPDGTVIWANDLEAVTYHTGGRRNHDGIGVVVCGDFTGDQHLGRDRPTDAQKEAFNLLIKHLAKLVDVQITQYYGHCDAPGGTMKAACPGYEVYEWVQALREYPPSRVRSGPRS